MVLRFFLLITSFACSYGYPEERLRKRYDGYEVLEIRCVSIDQQEHVHKLGYDKELDFWSEPRDFEQPTYILIPPHKIDLVHDYLHNGDVYYSVHLADIQPTLDAERKLLEEKRRNPEAFEFDINGWNTYEDIMAEMEEMAARCPEESGILCDTYVIGEAVEGRVLKVLRIRQSADEKVEPFQRQGIWIDSVIHAMEWLSISTCLKIADRLTRNYETDDTVRHLLDNYDWYLLPVMNPDGYEFVWDVDRLWRKNLGVNEGSECFGVDLNRNYDFMWGSVDIFIGKYSCQFRSIHSPEDDVSPLMTTRQPKQYVGGNEDPCTHSYQGPVPASEPETRAIQEEADRLSDTLTAWISMHIYGNMWMHPWGYVDGNGSCVRAEDHDELYRVVTAAADATQETYNTTWTRGSICETIYPAAGTTIDYVKGVPGIKYSFTPELRGPPLPTTDEIEPAYQEIWNGIVAIVDAILEGPQK